MEVVSTQCMTGGLLPLQHGVLALGSKLGGYLLQDPIEMLQANGIHDMQLVFFILVIVGPVIQ